MLYINIQYFGGRGGGGSGGARGGRAGGGGGGAAKATEQKASAAAAQPEKKSTTKKSPPKASQPQTYTRDAALRVTENASNGTTLVNEKGTVYRKEAYNAWSVTTADNRDLTGVTNETLAKRMTKGSWRKR